jgi:hypothetical protein
VLRLFIAAVGFVFVAAAAPPVATALEGVSRYERDVLQAQKRLIKHRRQKAKDFYKRRHKKAKRLFKATQPRA